jgi:hypothetical protein
MNYILRTLTLCLLAPFELIAATVGSILDFIVLVTDKETEGVRRVNAAAEGVAAAIDARPPAPKPDLSQLPPCVRHYLQRAAVDAEAHT